MEKVRAFLDCKGCIFLCRLFHYLCSLYIDAPDPSGLQEGQQPERDCYICILFMMELQPWLMSVFF